VSGRRHRSRAAALLLDDIVEWADRLVRHLDGVTREAFAADALIQDAVTRCIEVVGEASGQLLTEAGENDLAALRPQLRMAYLTRNRLSHGYTDIDVAMLWSTATEHVPALAAAVRRFSNKG